MFRGKNNNKIVMHINSHAGRSVVSQELENIICKRKETNKTKNKKEEEENI